MAYTEPSMGVRVIMEPPINKKSHWFIKYKDGACKPKGLYFRQRRVRRWMDGQQLDDLSDPEKIMKEFDLPQIENIPPPVPPMPKPGWA